MTDDPARTVRDRMGEPLGALIAALEKATGPSLVLDGEIWCAARGLDFVRWDGAGCAYRDTDGIQHKPARHIAAYTASIDAALTLVPSGHAVELAICPEMGSAARVYAGPIRENSAGEASGYAGPNDQARALCIAALKARAATADVGLTVEVRDE